MSEPQVWLLVYHFPYIDYSLRCIALAQCGRAIHDICMIGELALGIEALDVLEDAVGIGEHSDLQRVVVRRGDVLGS